MTVPAILFYDVVLFVHVTAIVLAFGVTFAYPIITPFFAKTDPRALPTMHRAQALVGKTLISGGMLVALIAGVYMASDRDLWSETWVTVPFVILLILGGMGGMFFGPTEAKAAEIAERDIAQSGDGPVQLSAEYHATAGRIAQGGMFASVLILVAIFFMTAKPFA